MFPCLKEVTTERSLLPARNSSLDVRKKCFSC
jgi:hypothetical protein